MSVFMFQGSYSAEAIKSLIANPTDRSGAARAVIEANGGTMVGAWMAFGESDVVVIAEMPDDESMAAVAMEMFLNPSPTKAMASRGRPAISPHRLTGTLAFSHCSAIWLSTVSMVGLRSS